MFDIGLTGAFIAGLVSFLSPCVLPMVPFYLSYLAGVSVNAMAEGADTSPGLQRRAVWGAVFFAAGMMTVFVSLGVSASVVGQFVREWFDVLRWVAAAMLVAFGWTPCVGPVLAAILFLAAGTDTAGQGALLLTGYGAGMTLPFILAALFVRPFLRFMGRFRRHLGKVERITGAALVVFGLLIATNAMVFVGFWMLETFEIFQAIG